MPKVSIIVPVYKAEKYLHRCVDSILAQTFTDWECILVDDGSPDGSGAICDEYAAKDYRIQVIHKENGGVSSARQSGMDAAIGEYVIHADPDDWIEPEMLYEMFSEAISNDYDLVICDFYYDYGHSFNLELQRPSALNSRALLLDLLEDRLHASCWNKLVRRSLFLKYQIRFPEGFSLYEDMYLITSLLLHEVKISYINKAYYHYIIGLNKNSISQVIGQSYEYDIMVMNSNLKLLEGSEFYNIAYIKYSSLVIRREFYRAKCSNFQFANKCFRLRRGCFRFSWPSSFLYYLACCGFYKPIYYIFKYIKNNENITD